ncbi:MAG: alpha/beta fold hydrolase [Solirubrobacteraceae bacterium]
MTDLVKEPAAIEHSSAERRPLYLSVKPDPVFAVLHVPDAAARGHLGVVFCPPFGWDELCTHRSMRSWADAVAADGHAAIRFDLPGTGDSAGSPRGPARAASWSGAIAGAAAWLRSAQDCERVVAVGIGLGGMLAFRAMADGAPIDDLVLWSVPARGGLLVRELRAFAQIAAGEQAGTGAAAESSAAAVEDGSLEVAGFLLSPATIAELEAIDLTKLPVADGPQRRVLLIGRDSIAPDRRLREHLERSGVALTVAEGPGFGRMMTHPQFAERPGEVYTATAAWLASAPSGSAISLGEASPIIASEDHIDLDVAGVTVREAPFEFDYRGKRLAGVLTQPTGARAVPGLCAVLLNAGAVRRIGPNRMWVEAARRWAAQGVPTLRIDAVGLGDSDGDERHYYLTAHFYDHAIADQVRAALDELESRGLPSSFLVGGLCSGAYWGFHAALADERIRGLILVNLWSFFWSEELAAARDSRRARTMLRAGAWRDVAKIAVSQGRIGRMARTMLRRVLRPHAREGTLGEIGGAIDDALAHLRERDVQTLLLLSEGEPLAEDFGADGRIERLSEWPNLELDRIPIEDHIFRPIWAQQHVHEALDEALDRTLSARS